MPLRMIHVSVKQWNLSTYFIMICPYTVPFKTLEFSKQFGDTFRVRIGGEVIIFTKDVKIIEVSL